MDIQRMVLVLIFGMSAVFLWTEWQRFTNPQPPAAQRAAAPATGAPAPATAGTPPASPVPVPLASPGSVAAPAVAGAPSGERITVETDLLRVVVNTAGGIIEEADLKTQQGTLDKNQPYQLLLNSKDRLHMAQAGLLGEGLPNHRTEYAAQPGPHKLDGAESVQLRLSAPITQGPSAGGRVDQILTFKKGSYVIDVAFEITNASQAPMSATAYYHLLRDSKKPEGESSMVPAYTGATLYDEADKFKKLDWSDIEKKKAKFTARTDNGWVAMVEHYFVAAIIPPEKTEREVYVDKVDDLYRVGVKIASQSIAPGATGRVGVSLYLGPQLQET
ncbi:MAG: membrane protein insertase YidC, partial [Acidobacteriota bacterium]